MRSFAAIVLTHLFGFVGAASASPLAWIGSVAVLVTSYLKAMKDLKKKKRLGQKVVAVRKSEQ
jgi:hypothetical protein